MSPAAGSVALLVDIDDFVVESERRGMQWSSEVLRETDAVVREIFSSGAEVASEPPDAWMITLHGRSEIVGDAARSAERLRELARRRVPSATMTVAIGEYAPGAADGRAVWSARAAGARKLVVGGDTTLHPAEARPEPQRDSADLRMERGVRDAILAGREPAAVAEMLRAWMTLAARAGGATPDDVRARLIVSLATVAADTWGLTRSDGSADLARAMTRLGAQRIADALVAHERSYLLHWSQQVIADIAASAPAQGAGIVEHAETYLRRRFADPGLTLTAVARALSVSPTHLSHRFRAERDTTFLTALTLLRVQAARALLADTELTVGAIAAAVGYSSTKQLWTRFRNVTGQSPLTFRSALRSSAGHERVLGRPQPYGVHERAEAGDGRVHPVAVPQR